MSHCGKLSVHLTPKPFPNPTTGGMQEQKKDDTRTAMITATATKKRSTFTEYHRSPTIRPATTRVFADDPFLARFGHKLPAGLRQEARGMQWRTFTATYAPTADLRLQFTSITRLPGSHQRYAATLTHTTTSGRTVTETEIIASGPMSAATHLLADAGRRVEVLSFHQFDIFESTVTFIYAGDNNRKHWAMGFGGSREQSAAAALSNAAYLLHG